MEDKELEWKTISSRRNVLLSRSDWTQLLDSGLTSACVVAWRKWRSELRNVRSHIYDSRLDATAEIRRLRDTQPEMQYSETDAMIWDQNVASLSYTDLTKIVKDIYEDHIITEAAQEPSTDDYLSDVEDITFGRSVAREVIIARYNDIIGNVSPASTTQILYMERLQQAIDLLSDVSDTVPLLEVTGKILGEDIVQVAQNVINVHNTYISKICMIEGTYMHTMEKINGAETLDELRVIMESYGH
jgi:hypothetical protein